MKLQDDRLDVSYKPTKPKKAICAVSGGMDSAVCLFHAIKEYGKENVVAASIYYGQKHDIELKKAREMCKHLNIELIELDLKPIFSINKNISALLADSDKEIEQDKTYAEIINEKVSKGETPISDEYIPNRNSLIINILCSIGLQKFDNEPVVAIVGIHSDDSITVEGNDIAAYPDCTLDFANATNVAIQQATAGLCYLYTPLVKMTKTEVALFGIKNGMNLQNFRETISCYNGLTKNGKQCGRCPTCKDRIQALVSAHLYMHPEMIVEDFDIGIKEASEFVN